MPPAGQGLTLAQFRLCCLAALLVRSAPRVCRLQALLPSTVALASLALAVQVSAVLQATAAAGRVMAWTVGPDPTEQMAHLHPPPLLLPAPVPPLLLLPPPPLLLLLLVTAVPFSSVSRRWRRYWGSRQPPRRGRRTLWLSPSRLEPR